MKLRPITSTMLNMAGYDEKNHELGVVFNTGDMYIYENVPQPIFTGLMEADSVGAYMHKYVIDKYPYRRMNRVGGTSPKERSNHKTTRKTERKGQVIPFRQKRDAAVQNRER